MIRLLKSLIDIIYPPRCPVCGKFLGADGQREEAVATSFCSACFSDFKEIASPLCPICGMPFPPGLKEDHLCEECLRKRPFYETAGAPYLYDGALMKAIHLFKYGSKNLIGESLGPLLARFAETRIRDTGRLLTMPVPLHPRRLRERGFNQSLVLARHVAGHLQTELDFLSLRRIKYTLPQTGLGKKDRQKNVRRAFSVTDHEAIKGKTILLVDDVSTTGNTLNECARVLRKSGCKRVFCLVLARAGNF